MLIRSQMSAIMGQVEAEHLELFALWKNYLEKLLNLCLQSSIYKYKPVSTKLGKNVCNHKISDEFDYGFNQIRTV